MSNPLITTERLTLGLWTLDDGDIDAAHRLWGDPRVQRWAGSGRTLDREGAQRCLEAGLRHFETHGCQHFKVTSAKDGAFIGVCGLNICEGPADLELVCHLLPEYWGKGYATEAARAVLDWAASVFHSARITASAHPDNVASIRLMKALGMNYREDIYYEDSGVWEPVFDLKRPPHLKY